MSTAVGILVASGMAVYAISRKLSRSSRSEFINSFLKTQDDKGEHIQNALDLYGDSNQKESIFYEAALESNLRNLDLPAIKSDLSRYLKKRRSVIYLRISTISLLLSIIALVSALSFSPDTISRTAQAWESFEKPNPFTYTVEPGSGNVEQGQTITPTIQFIGDEIPESVTLAFKTDVEDRYRNRPMTSSESRTFVSRGIDVTNSISYYIQMDDFQSESFRLDVEILPRFESLIATITPPSYTQIPSRELEYPFSSISVYPGSDIAFKGMLNKPIKSLELRSINESRTLPDSEPDSLREFTGSISPTSADTITFAMEDFDGLSNQNPFRTIVRMNEDKAPTVVIREPASDVMMNEPGELAIIYQATDDFGIRRAELYWELHRAYVDEPEQSRTRLSTPQNGRNTLHTWDLSQIDLRPRDEIRFTIRAMDNDEFRGGKWGTSKEIVVRVPSLAEFFDEIDSKERDVQSDLENVSESFDQMEQEYERFMERLRNNPEGGFEEQEMLESVSEKQQQIDETVKQLQEQFDELRKEMENSESISEETRESYRELQQLMEDLDDPDLQKALQELREAMENMNPNQMEEALENVSFNEELYKERLERTKELFKKLKMNSDLNKLAEQYEDLAERVKSRDDETLEQMRQEMETAEQDMDQLSEQLERLDDNPPKRAEERLKELKKQAQSELDQIKKQMQEMSDNADQDMQEGESKPSEQMQQQQEQMSQQLQQQADKMRQMQEQMSGDQLQVNILALQRALYTLLELSNTQEFLTQDAQETAHRSAGYVSLAREQNYIHDQFSSVADSIFQISSEIPGVPNRINRKKEEVERSLRNSVEQMAERNQRGATIASRESLGGINELSSLIASLIDQLMNQSGGGSGSGSMSMQQMMEQMKNMSGDQQQLNQQLQEMVNDMQGDRLSREQSERLDQLARQQNEIRKQLQELQRSGALNNGDRIMSELQRMMDEMEDSINDMRGGVTDDLMIERQQNILSRMLSAENAMEQRGEDEEREGSEADQLNYDLPPDMTLEELQQEIRSRLQDPDYTRFSEEYQRLIELYFERIRRMNEETIP
ncbi:DUF4175 family protein [Rhodohalobacter sp. 8-1]|uniref:DUF4175 family protein n=1 Tax=Rhodohalobacter sp. 8-1 TaxID=3131972 RepID=UPI0030EE6640